MLTMLRYVILRDPKLKHILELCNSNQQYDIN